MDIQPPEGPSKCGAAYEESLSPSSIAKGQHSGRVSLAYTIDYEWRNEGEFFSGLASIDRFLKRRWIADPACRHTKTTWCCSDQRIAVTFEYELEAGDAAD